MNKYVFILTFLLSTLSSFVHSATGSWNIVGDGNWEVNANWTGATYPDGSSEVATLDDPNATNATVTLSTPIELLRMEMDTTVTVNGSEIVFTAGAQNILKGTVTGVYDPFTYSGVTKLAAGNHVFQGEGVLTLNPNEYSIILADVREVGGVATVDIRDVKTKFTSATYTGATTIDNTGQLKFESAPLTPSISVATVSALAFDPTAPLTYSGSISGVGTVSAVGFNGGATTTLNGQLTYTGPTIVSNGGDLNLITSPPNSNAILANNLTYSPVAGDTQTFNGSIIFVGNVTVNGQGTQILTSNNIAHTGTTTVTRGTLNLSSTANITASPVTVNSGANPTTEAILTGEGTITNSLTNTQGVVLPGSSATTLMNVGSYTQTAAGIFRIRVTTTSASLLRVTNDAALNGTIDLTIAAGIYPAGTNFNVLTTGGALNGTTFSALTQDNSGTFRVRYITDNIVNIFIVNDTIIVNGNLVNLIGNALTSYNCISSNVPFILSNTDLNFVFTRLINLPDSQFQNALIRISSLPYASQTVINEQNLSQIARDLNQARSCNKCAQAKNGVFVEPIFINYNQRSTQGKLPNIGQIPFECFTYGSKIGYQRRLDGCSFFKMNFAYTHTNLHWEEGFGNSKWSSIYAGPSLEYNGEHLYFSFLGLGAANFYQTSRHIQFSTINRVAKSVHHGYDALVRGALGIRVLLSQPAKRSRKGHIPVSIYFVPEGAVNFITSWATGFSETNAAALNLKIANRTDYMLQPNCRGRFVFETLSKNICYSTTIYAGWLENIYFNEQKVGMRFKVKPGTGFCEIIGYKQNYNQLILGCEYNIKKINRFECSANLEANLQRNSQIYSGLLKFTLLF